MTDAQAPAEQAPAEPELTREQAMEEYMALGKRYDNNETLTAEETDRMIWLANLNMRFQHEEAARIQAEHEKAMAEAENLKTILKKNITGEADMVENLVKNMATNEVTAPAFHSNQVDSEVIQKAFGAIKNLPHEDMRNVLNFTSALVASGSMYADNVAEQGRRLNAPAPTRRGFSNFQPYPSPKLSAPAARPSARFANLPQAMRPPVHVPVKQEPRNGGFNMADDFMQRLKKPVNDPSGHRSMAQGKR